jgi:hypothetical protein
MNTVIVTSPMTGEVSVGLTEQKVEIPTTVPAQNREVLQVSQVARIIECKTRKSDRPMQRVAEVRRQEGISRSWRVPRTTCR